MVSDEGGSVVSSSNLSPEVETYSQLVSSQGKKATRDASPKFIKILEDFPVVALPSEDTIRVALSLAY